MREKEEVGEEVRGENEYRTLNLQHVFLRENHKIYLPLPFNTVSGVSIEHSTSSMCSSKTKCLSPYLLTPFLA